jgi:hypothetical protein
MPCQVRVEEFLDDGRRDYGRVAPHYVDHWYGRRRHETDRRTDDRGHGQFDDPDASGNSRTVFCLEAFEVAFELLARIIL